jgi:glutathione S-transferase
LLDDHLRDRDFFVGADYSVADVGIYGYTHVAHEAQIETEPYEAFRAWLARVEATPGFMNDLDPYPPNARVGASRSIYD